jgi:hypothetical protein
MLIPENCPQTERQIAPRQRSIQSSAEFVLNFNEQVFVTVSWPAAQGLSQNFMVNFKSSSGSGLSKTKYRLREF